MDGLQPPWLCLPLRIFTFKWTGDESYTVPFFSALRITYVIAQLVVSPSYVDEELLPAKRKTTTNKPNAISVISFPIHNIVTDHNQKYCKSPVL